MLHMELDECIVKRHSVHKFSPKEVAASILATIIKTGTNAPTAGNLQEWRFVVVTDETQKEKVANACEEQIWMANAGALIVVCTDNRDVKRFYGEPGNGYAVQDAAAAAMLMLLKAHELGLGSCWVSAFDEEKIKDILALPTVVVPHLIVVLGYSEETGTEKPHFTLGDLIYLNRYGKRAAEYPEMGEIIKKLVEKGKKAAKKLHQR